MELKDLTNEQKEELARYAADAKVKVANGVASGSMACLFCGEDVKVEHKNGNAWNAKCKCGWSASGIGVFTDSLN